MKIDVEGLEYEVIAGNDWKKYRPEVVCVEANHIDRDWRPILMKNKYHLVFNDGLNEYYLAEESAERMELFDYAKDFIENKRILSYGVHVEFQSILSRIEELSQQLESAEKEHKKREAALRYELAALKGEKRHFANSKPGQTVGRTWQRLKKILKKVLGRA